MRVPLVSGFASLLLLVTACSAPAPATPDPGFRPTSTVKDIMDSIVDPSADAVWDSVEVVVTASGTEERAPKTDDEWKEVRRRAVSMVEASNMLLVPGRHIARPGEKAENPKIELAPEQIESMVNADRAQWTTLAHGLHDAATAALKAIDDRDKTALLYSGDGLDRACENCHLKYWYPPDLLTKKP
jgi:hypothetical protein